MRFKNFFLYLKKTYIIFFISLLFLNFTTSDLKSSIFTVSDIEIIEPFEDNFKKNLVIDRAFREAFKTLTKMTVATNQSKKLSNIKIYEIKNLIESFNIKNEKFIQNSYVASFEVNFNKQNTLLFFEKKNVFPSIPSYKQILLIPILIDTENKNINIFDKNPFYQYWTNQKKKYHLLTYNLPDEDLDLLKILTNNSDNLEKFKYKDLVKKYGYNDYIICLIFKEKNKIKVFSRININNDIKIKSKEFETINFSDISKLNNLLDNIQNIYEDEWKISNQINRSLKLAINIDVPSREYNKNILFENFLNKNELVSKYSIKSFNNNIINYRIIFNGSPKKFLEIAQENGVFINTTEQVWLLK